MRLLLAAATLVFSLMAGAVQAGEAEIAAIRAVLAPEPLDTGLFAPEFLKAVPPAQLEPSLAQIKSSIGPVVSVTPQTGPSYLVETATHDMPVDIILDSKGRIATLFLHPAVPTKADLDTLLKDLPAGASVSAWLITRDGKTLATNHADEALPVGSAFKLGVLKALRSQIDSGKRHWDDVVTLADADLSLPSGTLQTWPVGSPLTLHTLAALMISISDNTATDTLIHTVGRDAVEAMLGIAPVLTTRELFTLKADPDLMSRYTEADVEGKRAIIIELDGRKLPDIAKVMGPHTPGAEWDLSAETLCALMQSVDDLDVTRINPGPARKLDWDSVAYKGGSEVGVLSMVTAATGKDGAQYCFAAIWNDPAEIDESKAGVAYATVLAKLAKGD
jgi:hypothetical protein